ncbi:ROK family transcriptional regulator [Profundibacterium mesophilum]|uniref:Xylose operon repressor n=1 Tax=Profundibacterium mesophilum KAUST100406-0324 TaxID=1037889 RepID=A0A921TDM0_9RHOB|nr:ROK family transcriptional regulator [Profundibacterium mesophilum]KAF0676963.1 Xylose operon repressor [Profundibacterium mesophilum KAUST100406-0324]
MTIQTSRDALPEPPVPPGCGPLLASAAPGLQPLRQTVFETVRAAGTIARRDVARALGVSPASVTAAVTELINAGYLDERSAPPGAEGGRGRPAVALAVRPGAGFVAGLQFAPGRHSAVIHDLAGTQIASAILPGDGARLSLDTLKERAARLMAAALAAAELPADAVIRIGAGVPGFVDSAAGRVLWSPLVAGRNIDLAAELSGALGCEVVIDNDAHLIALAELWFGQGRGVRHFAVVTIEHGVGMGLVLDNRLYRGVRGLGTELGHTKVQLDGALCQCGQRGCLEAYVSDYALLREAPTALGWPPRSLTDGEILERLYDEAKAGNAAARSIFRRAGRFLAAGLGNIVNLFDPELIVLSGARMRWDYLHADELMAEMARAAIVVDGPAPRLETHVWGDLVWARGAAALALTDVTGARFGAAGARAAQ